MAVLNGPGSGMPSPPEHATHEPRGLSTEAIDGGIGEFHPKIRQKRNWRMQPLLADHRVDVLVVIGGAAFECAADELVAGAKHAAHGEARRRGPPWPSLRATIFPLDMFMPRIMPEFGFEPMDRRP